MEPSNKSKSPNNLTESVSNEIVRTTVDLGIEYSELALDDFLADGILKEIPFIKTIYSIGKLGLSIKERHFVKKLLVFLKEFHSKTLDEYKISDFKFRFDTDKKYRNQVTEHLMVYTDSFLNIDKAKVFANLFRAFIYGAFDWNHFIHLSTCLNLINLKAFSYLEMLAKHDFKIPEDNEDTTPLETEKVNHFYILVVLVMRQVHGVLDSTCRDLVRIYLTMA